MNFSTDLATWNHTFITGEGGSLQLKRQWPRKPNPLPLFNDIATKEYERVLEECTKDVNGKGFCYYDGKNRETYIEVTLEEHKNNKETFISNIESKLDEIIKVYIQDGKIKYDYTLLSIRLVNEAIGTGGPFPHTVVEVGEYK